MIKLNVDELEITTFAVAPEQDAAALAPSPVSGLWTGICCPIQPDPITVNGCETGPAGYC
ncbi:hypothetical protein [Longimicrobium sp.]|uniref:hypothetical protein n=1 Tax=Longimicrobium sp. TaxID=2029185 RepID=UPI002E2F3BC4|nr:hypothetical protein [Longimicrobium sp.]HEX6041045.1 hypothetical protein [Longimicrobium sp.]